MLSKIVSSDKVEKLHVEEFKIPSAREIEPIIKEKKREAQRKKIIGSNTKLKQKQQVKQIQQNYLDSLEELATLKQIIYNQLENRLMDLVFSVSRQVIASEIKTSPGIVLKMLKKGFDKIKTKDAKEYEIKINPADYETIINRKKEIKEIMETSRSVKFTKDKKVERGGCQIITEKGEISSEPGKQLDIIKGKLSDEPGP
ncbi:MAG: hypothetical protein JSV88_01480 [Candidatus Aminicenantes bacterium]|nr:MAG: hypothetical protein JSV88_01480 [Candidatus Aminicenantes bacterium]